MNLIAKSGHSKSSGQGDWDCEAEEKRQAMWYSFKSQECFSDRKRREEHSLEHPSFLILIQSSYHTQY